MERKKVEYAIIGSGTAGLGAYSRIRRQTDSFVMIQHGPYGTTCARVGCMPSKMLITAADHAHDMSRSEFFGVHGQAKVDGKQVFERIRRDRADKFVGNVLKQIKQIPEQFKMQGLAKFVANNQIQVGDHTLIDADKVIIACGSRPFIPKPLQAVASRLLTSDSIFEIDDLPKSIAIIGLGVIALELGQSFHRLGVRTSLFGRSGRIGDLSNPEMQMETLQCLSNELQIYPHGDIVEAVEQGDGVCITFEQADGTQIKQSFEAVLVAAGRIPNVDRLNIEATDVPVNDKGIPVYDSNTMQCGDLPIFIAGDATDDLPLWHEAYDEGRIAGDNALSYPQVSKRPRRVPLGIYFTDPQMAVVGRSYSQLVNEEADFVIGDVPFTSPRHMVWNKTDGRIQVYAQRSSGQILGAELLGHQAEHLAHLLALAITHGLSVDDFLKMPIYHPSAEEVLKRAIEQAKWKCNPPISRSTSS